MTKKKLGLLLIIMGIMLIAAALSLNYYNYFHEQQSNKRMEAVLRIATAVHPLTFLTIVDPRTAR